MRDELIERISRALQPVHLEVQVEGNRASLIVVSEQFQDLNRVKRQQKVYALINDFIQSGDLHAVNIQAQTPSEWNG